jgi:hypothetical protein
MSVPGRIGIILIITLAMIDALILASGARDAAVAIGTHSPIQAPPAEAASSADAPIHQQSSHERLLSAAIREIRLLTAKRPVRPAGI